MVSQVKNFDPKRTNRLSRRASTIRGCDSQAVDCPFFVIENSAGPDRTGHRINGEDSIPVRIASWNKALTCTNRSRGTYWKGMRRKHTFEDGVGDGSIASIIAVHGSKARNFRSRSLLFAYTDDILPGVDQLRGIVVHVTDSNSN